MVVAVAAIVVAFVVRSQGTTGEEQGQPAGRGKLYSEREAGTCIYKGRKKSATWEESTIIYKEGRRRSKKTQQQIEETQRQRVNEEGRGKKEIGRLELRVSEKEERNGGGFGVPKS